MTIEQRDFTTYLRTKMLWNQPKKGENLDSFIYLNDLDVKRFFPSPQYDYRIELAELIHAGLIKIKVIETENGKRVRTYRVLKPGNVNPSLLKPKGQDLDPITGQMLKYLMLAELKPNTPTTLYFETFLKIRTQFPRLFFTVDNFSGRVHTPVSTLKSEYRKNILIQGEETISFDVVQMQPLILGKILYGAIGENDFSNWMESGEDIYSKIQEKAYLNDREAAKSLFYSILFNKYHHKLESIFGASDWIESIKKIKQIELAENPHSKFKPHSNLAWLLQKSEVRIMRQIWSGLVENEIPFLSVHDEIIISKKNKAETKKIMNKVLAKNFTYYKTKSNG